MSGQSETYKQFAAGDKTKRSAVVFFFHTFYTRLFEVAPAVRPLFKEDFTVQGRALVRVRLRYTISTFSNLHMLPNQPIFKPNRIDDAGSEPFFLARFFSSNMQMIEAAVKLLDARQLADLKHVLQQMAERHVRYGAVRAHYAVVGDVRRGSDDKGVRVPVVADGGDESRMRV